MGNRGLPAKSNQGMVTKTQSCSHISSKMAFFYLIMEREKKPWGRGSNSRKEGGFILAHRLRVQCIMLGKTQQGKSQGEAHVHTVSTVRKQQEINDGAFSFP